MGQATGSHSAMWKQRQRLLGREQLSSARRNLGRDVLCVQVRVEVRDGESVCVQVKHGKTGVGGIPRGCRLGIRGVVPLDRPGWVFALQGACGCVGGGRGGLTGRS